MPNIKITKTKLAAAAIFIAVLGFGLSPQMSGAQSVSDLQRQIDSLNQEISQNEDRLAELRNKRDNLENRLEILDAEAEQLQHQIDVTEQEMRRTQSEIRELEEELERTKELIQENVKVLYKEGSPSTLEVLFSSENFTDFVNRQEYLDKVKSSLNEAARESVLLKEELEEKEADLSNKVEELNIQRQQLANKQEEQRELIAETRGEEERYQQIVEAREQERERLERQQREAIAAAMDSRGGPDFSGTTSYPWPNAPMNYNDRCVYPDGSDGSDGMGYCLRQCTSYVAWRLNKDGKSGYMYLGHAVNWGNWDKDVNFRNAKHGDVIVWDVGGYGHVMYVEGVSSEGVHISQFNVPYDSGRYSEDFYTFNELENGVRDANGHLTNFTLRSF